MRRRIVLLGAGLLALSAVLAIPFRKHREAQVAVSQTGPLASPVVPKIRSTAKCDFKRTLKSAQVSESVKRLDVVSPSEEVRYVRAILGIAGEHLGMMRYTSVEAVAEAVLAIVPRCRAASALKEDAERAQRSLDYARFLQCRRERSSAMTDENWSSDVPAEDRPANYAVHLSRKEWDDLLSWARNPNDSNAPLPEGARLARAIREDEEVNAIQHKLEHCKIDIEYADSTLYDIVDFIQEFAKINIVISAEVRKVGIPDQKTNFEVRDQVLKDVLKELLSRYALTYTYENRVLLVISSMAVASSQPVLEVHDVHELLESGRWTGERLEITIKEEIESNSWLEREGEVSIDWTEEGKLYVVHTPQVQSRLRALLASFRDSN